MHRDLKPENVFIGLGPDGMNNVKIGDFGLATSGHYATDKSIAANVDVSDLTRSIGTSYYVAPEVRRTGAGSYTSKVDVRYTTNIHLAITNLVIDVFSRDHIL